MTSLKRYQKISKLKMSFGFQSNTGKWQMVLRALWSRMGNETFSNSSFSFLVDSPLVRALGIRKWFLDFILGIEDRAFFRIRLENLVSFKVTSNLSFGTFAPRLGIPKYKFGSGNLESEKKLCFCELGLESNVLTERFFFSFVNSALEIWNQKRNIQLWNQNWKYLALELESET
ncbi:hypothetical protein C1645_835828 [Glomus cerebriforme]|uniref:Uncharacterized protein n=1 Tax=Glomus cerebriforme TaxID=658196 RepID=A0A397SDQ9_9GLOM|nr:hypothetical protein C1645_835828 [Glomus cerebriforme]